METQKNWTRRLEIILPIMALILLIAITASVVIGSAGIKPATVLRILIYKIPLIGAQIINPDWVDTIETIVWEIRMPRTFLAAFVGIALSVAGVAFQGILRNPLSEPYTVGVSAGAAIGAAFVIVFGIGSGYFGLMLVPVAAFLGAFLTIITVYRLASVNGRFEVDTLILAGVAVSAFINAILTFFMTLAGDNVAQLIFWLMGSFSLRTWEHVLAIQPYLIIGYIIIWLNYRELNILSLGEESAGNLGVNVEKTKILLLFSGTLMAGGAVALSGTIGFVGLVIPHMMRLIFGPDHRVLIPASAFAGAIFLVFADILSRTLLAPVELPVGVVTAFLGSPFFAYLLRKHKNRRRLA